jgi:hypothetical protein
MRKYALIINNIIVDIQTLDEEQYRDVIKSCDLLLDIEDMNPQPMINWVLNGNTLEIPQGSSNREVFEEELNNKKSLFGYQLAKTAVNKIGARNKILNKNGSQVTALLTQLLGIKNLLETGALGTARYACLQLILIYTEYSDILQLVIDEINKFEKENGL